MTAVVMWLAEQGPGGMLCHGNTVGEPRGGAACQPPLCRRAEGRSKQSPGDDSEGTRLSEAKGALEQSQG